MLSIKYIQKNIEKIKHSVKARELDVDVDLLLKIYDKWKKTKRILDDLRRERNFLTEKISELKKQKKEFRTIVEKSKENKIKLKDTELTFKDLDNQYRALHYKIPNILHKDVPISDIDKIDWESNIKIPEYNFKPKKKLGSFERFGFSRF